MAPSKNGSIVAPLVTVAAAAGRRDLGLIQARILSTKAEVESSLPTGAKYASPLLKAKIFTKLVESGVNNVTMADITVALREDSPTKAPKEGAKKRGRKPLTPEQRAEKARENAFIATARANGQL